MVVSDWSFPSISMNFDKQSAREFIDSRWYTYNKARKATFTYNFHDSSILKPPPLYTIQARMWNAFAPSLHRSFCNRLSGSCLRIGISMVAKALKMRQLCLRPQIWINRSSTREGKQPKVSGSSAAKTHFTFLGSGTLDTSSAPIKFPSPARSSPTTGWTQPPPATIEPESPTLPPSR